MDDWKQLQAFGRQGDERAFAVIVRRYVNLVHSAAYRQLGDRTAAEDVTQTVFALLARKARRLKPTGSLGAWLYRTACLCAKAHLRKEHARQQRETRAMNEICTEEGLDEDWKEMAPILDDAMLALSNSDREVLVLRFFEKRALGEVGAVLGISEEAARKRVARALQRLRAWFSKRGIQGTATALSSYAVLAAPDALAQSVIDHVGALPAVTASGFFASTKWTLLGAFVISASLPSAIVYFSPKPVSQLAQLPPIELNGETLPASSFIEAWEALKGAHASYAQREQAIAQLPTGYRKRAFQSLLVAEWIETSPAEALRHFMDLEDWAPFEEAWKLCLRLHGKAAVALLAAEPEVFQERLSLLLPDVADVAPEFLTQLAPLVPMRHPADTRLQYAFTKAARNDLEATRDLLGSLEGEALQEATAGVAKAWAETDGPAALKWVKMLESSEIRSRSLRALLEGWAKSDPIAALNNVSLAPKGGGYDDYNSRSPAEQVMSIVAEQDLEMALDWLAEHQDYGYLSAVSVPIVLQILEEGPDKILSKLETHPLSLPIARNLSIYLLDRDELLEMREWLSQQPNTEFTTALRNPVISGLPRDTALEWINELVREDQVTSKDLQELARSFNLDRPNIDRYLARAEPAMREALFAMVIPRLASRPINLAAWDTYLTEIDGDLQMQAAIALGKKRAQTNPQVALQWAETLPQAALRDAAQDGILELWRDVDPSAYDQWRHPSE